MIERKIKLSDTEEVKDFPLLLGEVETHKVITSGNREEAKEIAKNAEKLREQGVRVTTTAVAEKRKAKGRKVVETKTTGIRQSRFSRFRRQKDEKEEDADEDIDF